MKDQMAWLWMLATCAVVIIQYSDGRKCAPPTLFAGAMTGLGLKDYDHELVELDPRETCSDMNSPFRTIDGTCNNEHNLGAANTRLARLLPAAYDDGVDRPRTRSAVSRGQELTGARIISRRTLPDRLRRNDNTLLLMQWGQFLDHDMTLMPLPTERIQEEGGDPLTCCRRFRIGAVNPLPEECLPITFRRDRDFAGTCMEFVRTVPAMKVNPGDRNEPREQVNSITAFIDASSVYGSSLEEEEELRECEGLGFLLKFEHSDQGPLLPRTERAICRRERNDPVDEPVCFIAGDERVNEQPDLATIHTIFLRLHNLIASRMARVARQDLDLPPVAFNETIFQSTRRVVGAIVQKIMYGDWLPIILGDVFMEAFKLNIDQRSEYNPSVNPTILNEFSTAAYRMGHSLVPRNLPTPDRSFRRLRIPLREHFLRPAVVRERFNSLAMGLVMSNTTTARDQAQAIDTSISRDLTEHLFEPPGQGLGQDLMSLNIQRGRDHGLPPYNDYRHLFNLSRVQDFGDAEISNARRLATVYDSVDDIDLFVGGLAEPPNSGGGQLGETFSIIVAEQMMRLKFGDRFFFTHDEPVGFTERQLAQLRNITSSKVMCLTVDPITSMQRNAFVEAGPGNPSIPCEELVENFSRDFLDVADFVVEADEEYLSHKK